MASAQLKALSEKTGKSMEEVEKLWDKAKTIVSKEYKDVSKEKDSDKYYSLVMGVLKKSLGVKESFIDMIDAEMIQLDEIMHEKKKEKSEDDEEDEEVEDEKKEKKSPKKDDDEEDEEVEDENKEK
jgi:hypothetical protein